MKLLELRLAAFGAFTDTTLDLSQGNHGLHLIYGPNEAGKSTALRAIEYALYGIPNSTPYAFLHDYKSMRVGGKLRNVAGKEIAFLRRKGKQGTLLNPDHKQGTAHPDNALRPFLGSTGQEEFSRIFSMDYAELERGGEQLGALKGLAGESLFAAGLGGPRLAEILAQLEDEAAALFGPKKRNATINASLREYADASKTKREAAIPSTRWQAQQNDLKKARGRLSDVKLKLREFHTQETRITRLRSSLHLLRQRSGLIEQQAQNGDVVVLPDDYSSENRSTVQAKIESLTQQIQTLKQRLSGDGSLREQVAAIAIPDGLLDNETLLVTLYDQLQGIVVAEADRDNKLLAKQQEIREQIQRKLKQLGIDADWSKVEKFRLSPEDRVQIQDLGNESTICAKPAALEDQRQALELDLETIESNLAELGPKIALDALMRHCADARAEGDLERDIRLLAQEVSSLHSIAERDLAALGLWQGAIDELTRLRLPMRETVDRFEREQAELLQHHRQLETTEIELAKELDEVQQQLRALQQESDVPTEARLNEVRELRDGLWQTVRDDWLAGTVAPSESNKLAKEYDTAVRAADEVVDRLRREADRVSKLADRQSREAMIQHRQEVNVEAMAELRRQLEAYDARWKSEWADVNIAPLAAREMLGWLQRFGELRQQVIRLEQVTTDLNAKRSVHDVLLEQTRALLAEFQVGAQDTSLSQLLGFAGTLVAEAESADRTRAALEDSRAATQKKIQQLDSALQRAIEEREVWQKKWAQSMELLSCPVDATPGQANAKMIQLEELIKLVDDHGRLERRIEEINQQCAGFDKKATEMLSHLTGDLDATARQAIIRHQGMLNAARQDSTRLQGLLQRIEETERELDELQVQLQTLEAELRVMCQMAGVTEQQQLPEIEKRSLEFTQRRDRLQHVEHQLLELGQGLTLEELVADAEGQDADALSTQLIEIQEEIQRYDEQRDEIVATVTELEAACAEDDCSSVAANADQQALGLLGRIHEDSARYVKLRFAHAILKQQIERHRAENQDPLLSHASDLFARMTCAEFKEIRTEYGDSDRPFIVGVRRRENEQVMVDAMSGGTRDQLYLALRLAYLQSRLPEEPMPLVVDDILVEFDDDRSRATLEILADLSDRMQVIFFTHHRHIVELSESALTRDKLFVHCLEGPSETVEPPSVTNSRPR